MRDESEADDRASAGRGGLCLLMVEDQRFDAMLLRKQLASPSIGAGHVDHAETLAGAIDAMQQRDYDAVLLDLGLADSDGVAAVRTLRERFPEVVVVVLTGRDEEQLGIDAMASGAQDMLIKGSFDAEALGRALHYAIERQRLEIGVRQSSEEHRTLVDKEAPAPAGSEGLVEELADPAFEQGLEEASPGAEEAMDALEAAMEEAEARSKAAAASLGTEPAPQPPPGGESER